MSRDSVKTITDPVLQSKMPLFDTTIVSTGLTKSQNMSGFLGKQALQYNGSCFTFDPRGKDGESFTPPWKSNSKISLLDGRSPVTHLSGAEIQNHIIYRQDSSSSEEGHSHSSSVRHSPVKQGFMLYAKSPGISPTSAIRKQTTKAGSEKSSSHSENPVYLAIPKPVYRHNPCCNELGCVIAPRYTVEHSSQRIPNTIYEHDWMQTEPHYVERSPVQRKGQDALLQQRGLHFEAGTEPLKRITMEAYNPGKARALSTIVEPNYSSYPCTPTHTLFGSLSEHSQPLQTSPRGYPSLYSSQPTYEHMTSEVYQEHSLMPKYGHLAQHPMFYYPQANVEVENRPQCKDNGSKQREDVPVIHKHTISTPREHYIVPQPLHAEIPLPTTDMLSNHPFLQRFDYPCYAIPRFHLNASQIRSPIKRPHTSPSFHSSHINVSPSSQHHPTASATSLHKDKSSIGLKVNQLHGSSSFLHMDHISPTRHPSQPGVSPSTIQIGRFFSPLTSVHIDPPNPPPAVLRMNKLLDYSSCEAPKQAQSLPVSRPAWLSYPSKHSADQIHAAAPNAANVRKIIYSPAVATGNKHNDSVTSPGNGFHKGSLKRSISHPSAPKKIKEEDDDDVYEVEVSKKPKYEIEHKTDSPPMPIIDTVFSLAPYHVCRHTTGVLIQTGRAPQPTVHHFEQHDIKPSMDIKKIRADRDEEQPAARLVSKGMCLKNTPTEQMAVEPKNIKAEKMDTSDTDDAGETGDGESNCIKVTIKKEPEETDAPDTELVMLKVKCEPDELENKPSLEDGNRTTDESEHAALTAQTNLLSHSDTYTQHQQAVTLQPQTTAPPQPPESKVDFKNIPPQCLKLSTYNIIIPDIKHYSPGPLQEKPVALPVPEPTPKQEEHIPVRRHFFELHHCLCKLVSKSVSASTEHELKNWLCEQEINEPVSPSTKVQKVSCLLGVKARDIWINEEMKTALDKVLERLREYTTQERCPFPHVMRTGAVFLPMLVVKEILFPLVQGSFIDQVLQEHRVELRPTTLSEEKILIQLHKRACSSRLRRLMSLKHLPDVYADVVNLFYYTCVCKHLGLDTDADYKEQDGGCEASNSRGVPVFPEITASADTPSYMKDQETHSHLNRNRTKSRVKSSSRRMFLDDTLSDEEEAGDAVGGVLNTFTKKNWAVHEPQGTDDSGTDHMAAEQDSPFIQQGMTSENSWTCPLSLNELSPSDTEPEESSSLWPVSQYSGPAKPRARSKNCSGVILKLRKMLNEGLDRKKACYQAVSESETFADPSLSQTDDGEGGSSETDSSRKTPKVTHRWQRTGSFPHALRPLSGPSKRKNRSLLKIKYCPYLSACHSAERRKRWVLRSAVQRARRTMRFYYPDLVGKRIHHLYEEDDKSEVWYRGEVLRIHEAHTNPLKTIFEVRYDSEPEWKYYLELLIDYKKGWLKIED